MTVTRDPAGNVVLSGNCAVEDAEVLLQMLQASPGSPVDCRSCGPLHTAVVQVIMAAAPVVVGPVADPWAARWLGRFTKPDIP
jgi:hypothetical protein